MNSYLNYIIEANLGLCFFLVFYLLMLRVETDFRFKRIVMLSGVMLSLVFPMIHLQSGTTSVVPALNDFIPSYWLPEVVVGNQAAFIDTDLPHTIWNYITWIYAAGVGLFLVVFLIRLSQVLILIRRSSSYREGKFLIAESSADLPTFSFFYFIFVGRKEMISDEERFQIIRHEKVHGSRFHSFDILLLNILQIFFWFNPLLSIYKKIFIQLHEFEADARAVENRNVNDYCSLLARVALLSADFKLANHFNNSLTVKRITMMRTIKTKIRPWKVAAFFALLPVIFLAIACQDQIANDLNEIAKNSSGAAIVPEHVQQRYDLLTRENPGSKYILLQLNDEAMATIKSLEETYGLPKSMEVFKDNYTALPEKATDIVTIHGGNDFKGQSFAIFEYTDEARRFSEMTTDGEVFTVVEVMPQYQGGFGALGKFLGEHIVYPTEAAKAGVAGTVFTQFIVNPDGTLSDVTVAKGVNELLDNEAVRVVKSMPAWTPGMQDGKAVKVKFILPIKFAI